MYSSFILVPQFVEPPASSGFGFGASVTRAGLFMVPATAAMLLAARWPGGCEARFGSRLPLILGCAFAACARSRCSPSPTPGLSRSTWRRPCSASGIGLAFAAMANLIVEAVPADQTGVATGVNTITRTIGGAFGGQIVATIISGGGSPTESSFALAFAVIAGSLVLSILAALRSRSRERRLEPLRRWPTAGAGPGGPSARVALVQMPGSEDARAVLRDGDGELEVGRERAVRRVDGPAVRCPSGPRGRRR